MTVPQKKIANIASWINYNANKNRWEILQKQIRQKKDVDSIFVMVV